MVKSKSEMMRRLYEQRKEEGMVRISFWIPREMQQTVKDAVEHVVRERGKIHA